MTTTDEQSAAFTTAFQWVLDVYRNVDRLLLACDPVLVSRGFAPHADWSPFHREKAKFDEVEEWLPRFAVRQYHRAGRADSEVLTVGAYLFEPDDQARIPICIASLMATRVAPRQLPFAIYWMGLLQAWDPAAPPDGEVRALLNREPSYAQYYDPVLAHPEIRSVALPLLEMTDTGAVEQRLIGPLLAALPAD